MGITILVRGRRGCGGVSLERLFYGSLTSLLLLDTNDRESFARALQGDGSEVLRRIGFVVVQLSRRACWRRARCCRYQHSGKVCIYLNCKLVGSLLGNGQPRMIEIAFLNSDFLARNNFSLSLFHFFDLKLE